jgi:hypothetical protein
MSSKSVSCSRVMTGDPKDWFVRACPGFCAGRGWLGLMGVWASVTFVRRRLSNEDCRRGGGRWFQTAVGTRQAAGRATVACRHLDGDEPAGAGHDAGGSAWPGCRSPAAPDGCPGSSARSATPQRYLNCRCECVRISDDLARSERRGGALVRRDGRGTAPAGSALMLVKQWPLRLRRRGVWRVRKEVDVLAGRRYFTASAHLPGDHSTP